MRFSLGLLADTRLCVGPAEDRAVTTDGLTKSFGWEGAEAFAQQDVQEMFNHLSTVSRHFAVLIRATMRFQQQ